MRLTIRPIVTPQHEIDVTKALITSLAEILRKHYGGNNPLNGLEAELHLHRLFAQSPNERGSISERENTLVSELLAIAEAGESREACEASPAADIVGRHAHHPANHCEADYRQDCVAA